MVASAVHAYATEEGHIKAASTFDLYPFTIDRITDYYGRRLKVSDFACKLPETAALKPQMSMDCRSWTVRNVLLGKIEMDTVVYGATITGLVTSFYHTKATDCNSGLRDFLHLQSLFFRGGNAKVVGFRFGDDGHLSKGTLRMDEKFGDSDGYKYLELEYSSDKCDLTYAYNRKN